MYKFLLVDDEPIVLKSLKYILEKNLPDILALETARTGREAIQKAEDLVPDIVFMDIKMPGINGLDAVKEIKSRCKNTVFVILTAYGQFNFAKEAINMGVIEYLLKPMTNEKVIEAVSKAIDVVRTARENRRKELELKEKLESVVPMLENGFISSLLFFDDNVNELGNYKQIFDIGQSGGYIMTIELGEFVHRSNTVNKIGTNVKSQLCYPLLREAIKSRCKCIVGPVLLNRIVVIVLADIQESEYTQRLEAIGTARDILGQLQEKLDMDFRIGLGKFYSDIENLALSYKESLKAIRFAESKEVMHIMDISAENEVKYSYPYFREKQLLEKANQGDAAACTDIFNHLFDWLINEHGRNMVKVQGKLIGLLSSLQRLIWEYEAEEGEISYQAGCFEELLAFREKTELKAWCKQKIENLVNSISMMKEKRISCVSLKAKDFINRNFFREISLEDVAREVNISPNYFSKIFKEETGKSFIDYLTFVRMQKAKELLENGENAMKEICFLIGYSDPNYFSRIFKKFMGISPSEYKERGHTLLERG